MRGCLLFRMRALTLYGSIVLSFCHFRTNKSPPRPRQMQRARPMSTPNWLRFRAGEKAHVVTGMSGPMHLTPCGYAAHGATGVVDKRAKRCRACSRAVRPVSPQEWRKAGHFPE